jgi:hypothetical protein
VIHQLKTQGVLGDLGKMQSLLAVAKRYLITDAGWNLLDFAAQARSLTAGNLVFRTLPIKGYAVINGQDANVVAPAYIKQIVKSTFYGQPAPPHARHYRTAVSPGTTTVDVLNGGNTTGLAGRVAAALVKAGYRGGTVGNTGYRTTTAVLYGRGASANAGKLAAMFGVTAAASGSVSRGHVEILLGTSATVPRIHASSKPQAGSPVVVPSKGPQGGAIIAKNGIPCVN